MTEANRKFTGERLVPGDDLLQPMRVENLARFKFFLERAAGSYVLDLGCGTGEGSGYLARRGTWFVVGADIAHGALSVARSEYASAGLAFVQADATRLSFAARQFDAVISVEVIEHLVDPGPYLREVARVLKASGVFVLTTPNRLRSSPTPGSLWPEHVREFSPGELETLLRPHFSQVALWGEFVPIYEAHPARRLMRRLAPLVKPVLPRWLRVRALPAVQVAIKRELSLDDVRFTQDNLADRPTLVAVCGPDASAPS